MMLNQNVPTSFVAGTTVTWTASHSDFPASTHVLKYFFRGPSAVDVTASADGDDYAVEIAPADSAKFAPGWYEYQAVATIGTAKYLVETGRVEVEPGFESLQDVRESRSALRVIVDSLETVLKNQSTKGYEQLTIGDMSITQMNMADITTAYFKYKAALRQEENTERLNAGLGTKTKIVVRMT